MDLHRLAAVAALLVLAGPAGSGCFRHHRGWWCGSAAFAFRPRLFSCSRPTGSAVAYEMRGRVIL